MSPPNQASKERHAALMAGKYSGLDRKLAEGIGLSTSGTIASLFDKLSTAMGASALAQKIMRDAAAQSAALGWRSFELAEVQTPNCITFVQGPGG